MNMVYVLLGTGFEEIEALTPVDLLRRAGVEVKTVGLNGKIVYGGHAIGVEADLTIDELKASSDLFDEDVYEAINLENCMALRASYGGPAVSETTRQIAAIEAFVAEREA